MEAMSTTRKETLCWNCSIGFDITDASCPGCGMANANVDFDKAARQSSLLSVRQVVLNTADENAR